MLESVLFMFSILLVNSAGDCATFSFVTVIKEFFTACGRCYCVQDTSCCAPVWQRSEHAVQLCQRTPLHLS
jgi:hypothetical protein